MGLAVAVATVLVVLDVIARVSVVSPRQQPAVLLGRETTGSGGGGGGSDALRAKLRASVAKQRQLGDKVHALVAAAMFKGKRQALAQEEPHGEGQAEMIAHLKVMKTFSSAVNLTSLETCSSILPLLLTLLVAWQRGGGAGDEFLLLPMGRCTVREQKEV